MPVRTAHDHFDGSNLPWGNLGLRVLFWYKVRVQSLGFRDRREHRRRPCRVYRDHGESTGKKNAKRHGKYSATEIITLTSS